MAGEEPGIGGGDEDGMSGGEEDPFLEWLAWREDLRELDIRGV